MFIKLFYITIQVTDQDRALNFYTQLGFEKRVDYPGPDGRFLTLGFKGQDVEILLWKGTPATNSSESSNVNPGIIFLETKDLRADFKMMSAKGVRFIENEPVDYPWGVRVTALDPDGNRLALRQRKG